MIYRVRQRHDSSEFMSRNSCKSSNL